MDTPMIQAEGLSKYYGQFAAVEDVSFKIPQGQVAAFLGPNGAGKSTTMKLLTGFLSPSRGGASLGGFDIATQRLEAANILGYLPENGPLYLDMTPWESLKFCGALRGLKGKTFRAAAERVIDLCHLSEVLHKPTGKLSKGYRQRVGMATVLLHDPKVIIMDEPTSGLDPNQIRTVRQTIRDLGKDKTVLLSTHILQEVEAMATRVLFINEGRLVFDGDFKKFTTQAGNLDDVFAKLTSADAPAPSSDPDPDGPDVNKSGEAA